MDTIVSIHCVLSFKLYISTYNNIYPYMFIHVCILLYTVCVHPVCIQTLIAIALQELFTYEKWKVYSYLSTEVKRALCHEKYTLWQFFVNTLSSLLTTIFLRMSRKSSVKWKDGTQFILPHFPETFNPQLFLLFSDRSPKHLFLHSFVHKPFS